MLIQHAARRVERDRLVAATTAATAPTATAA
jgi:hypothetical protein